MSGERGGFHFELHDEILQSFYDGRFAGGELHGDAPAYMGLNDFLHATSDYGGLARAFDLTCFADPGGGVLAGEAEAAEEEVSNSKVNSKVSTPNSSVSSSSTEAAGEDNDYSACKKERLHEDLEKKKLAGSEEGSSDQKLKKVSNNKTAGKKGEKRQREPRFAFMTKSEVDHLEDGYRWRKYGQKAVKNSPYPRSYYRCTTHKCTVKKRVERSFQDPTVVITTYEGQHTHPSPTTLRGGSQPFSAAPAAAASTFYNTFGVIQQPAMPPPPLPPSSHFLIGKPEAAASAADRHRPPHPLHQLDLSDHYGLLQDMFDISSLIRHDNNPL